VTQSTSKTRLRKFILQSATTLFPNFPKPSTHQLRHTTLTMIPEPRARTPSVKAVDSLDNLAIKTKSASRSRSISSTHGEPKVKLKLKSLLPTPPQTPSPLGSTTTLTLQASKKKNPPMFQTDLTTKVPIWMFKPSVKAATPPLPPSPTINLRIYSEVSRSKRPA